MRDDFGGYAATLYAIAQVTDVGNQLLRQSGTKAKSRDGTFEDYIARLYGPPKTDWFQVLGWIFTFGLIALVLTVAALLGLLR